MRPLVVLCLAVLVAAPAVGQRYAVTSYGVDDRLGHVRSLAFDPDGFLWLATPRGLIRYDGVRFTAVTGVSTFQVAAGTNGDMWLWAGNDLLLRSRDGNFEAVSAPDQVATALEKHEHGRVRLFPLTDGRLVLLDAGSGLWLLEPSARQWVHLLSSAGDAVQSFAETGDGDAWVLTRTRLGRLSLASGDTSPQVEWVTSDFHVGRHVRQHPQGAWIMADRGLHLYRDDGAVLEVLGEAHRSWFTIPDVGRDGTLAFTAEGPGGRALYLVNPDGEVRLSLSGASGLRATTFDAVRFDGEGGLWMASEHGLDHLEDPERLIAFPVSPLGVTNLRVEPTTGVLWAGTYGGLFRYTEGAFEAIGPPRAAIAPEFDESGAAHWIAFGGHAGEFRRWSYRSDIGSVSEGSLTKHFRATLPDGRSIFERRLESGGVGPAAVLLGDRQVLADGRGLGGLAVGPAPRQRVWIALGEDLDTIENESLGSTYDATPASVLNVIAKLDGLGIRRMEADRFGRIWLATLRGLGVLYETAPDEWDVLLLGPTDDLPTAKVIGLDVADGERLWLGTDLGAFGFTLHRDEPWLRPIPLASLNKALATEVILDLREDGEGALWISPVGEGTLYRYDWRGEALASPQVRLTGLAVNDRPQSFGLNHLRTGGSFKFRADTTRLTFSLGPQTLRRLTEVRYQYRLLGLSSDWVDLDHEASARFAYLGPGQYTFEARSVRAGQLPGPVLSVPIQLVPRFYQALWFRVLCGGLLVVVFVAGAWRRARLAEERAAALEAVVAERTIALETEKRTTEQQAERLMALDEAKSRFFANVSHELRTPLTLLLGPLRDAATGRSDADAWQRQLPLMRRSGERLLGLVDQLLDLARLDAGHLRLQVAEYDLVALSRRIVLGFSSRAEREGVALGFEAAAKRLVAWVDAERYEQVLSNLLVNAFKFTPSGGRIRVTLEAKEGNAILSVRDTGEGIPADMLPHVFERFRQADDAATRRHEGTGIGLALVRELVGVHGGKVTADSTAGFGSQFVVSLPLGRDHFEAAAFADAPAPQRPMALPEPGEAMEEEAVPTSSTTRPGGTVLIVDDHADMRAYLHSLLAQHYVVVQAEDGQAGLTAARRLARGGRPPDLVISDVMMPGFDGYALCRALKADDALGHVPVVLLTARADDESKLEGLGEGADDYLAKPFNADELLTRCENLIEVRRRLRARFSAEVVIKPTDVAVPVEAVDWLEEVKAVCEVHLADAGFGVDWLADALDLSARQLRRRLKEASGLTPGAFLRTMRLERAAQLLEAGAPTVAEVAAAVGYTDAESFSRAFRQGFGVPPSVYGEREGTT